MTTSSTSTYQQGVLKNLATDIYSACRRYDLKILEIPNTQDSLVKGLQSSVRKVFKRYMEDEWNGLSETTRNSLEGTEKMMVNYIPVYVQKRKEELGIKERKKPSSKSEVIQLKRGALVGAILGASIPLGIEAYSAITGDQTPKNVMYEGDTFSKESKEALLVFYETMGIGFGFVTGAISDLGLTSFFRNKRTKKQHRPLYKYVKEHLQAYPGSHL